MQVRHFYRSLIVSFFLISSLFGQTETSDALDRLNVSLMCKDHYGRIWLVTYSDLYCYDGSQLIEFNSTVQPDVFDGDEISGMVFNDVLKKLILTTSNGMIVFDPVNLKGERLDGAKLKLRSLKKGLSLPCVDSEGNIWCTDNEMSLIRVDKNFNGSAIDIKIPTAVSQLYQNLKIEGFNCTASINNFIYIGTKRNEVCRYDTKAKKLSIISHGHRALSGVFPFGEKEIVYSDFSGIHFRNLSDTSQVSHIPTHLISFLNRDVQGELWYVLNKTQLYRLNASKEPELVFELNAEQINKHKIIREILIEDGKIWLATARGLITINKPMKAFTKIFDRMPGYSNVELSSRGIASWHDTSIICAGYNYLASYHSTTGKVRLLTTKELAKTLIPYGLCVMGDSLWIASEGGGLRLLDLRSKKQKQPTFTNKLPPEYFVFGGLIKCVTKVDSLLLLGEYGQLGLYDLTTQSVTNSFSPEWKYKWAREKTHDINQILQLDDDQILFVANGGVVITSKQFRVLNKLSAKDLPGGLSDFIVQNVMVDDKKRFWISTDRSGLCLFDPKTQKCKWYTTQNGLCDNTVYYSSQSNDGRIWVGTNYGLSVIDPSNGSINSYFEKDGLANNEFNTNSFFKASNGDLYLGGMKGVTRIVPKLLKNDDVNEKFILTSIHIAGRGQTDSVNRVNLTDLKTVDLPYGSSFLRVQFSLMNFSDANKYAFRLLGLDTMWVSLGNNGSVTFNSLSPGSYTLEVRAWNERGEPIEELIRLSIESEQIFYRKAWFIVLVAILFIALTGLIFYMIYNVKLRAMRQMAEMRLKIATDLHDHVGGLLNKTATQAELVMANSDQNLNTLNKIADNSRIAMNSMRDILWNLDPRNDNPESLVDKMSEYAHKMLEDTNSYTLDLNVLKKVQMTPEERQTIITVFSEAINNIAKHATGEKVEVKAGSRSNGIELMILNSGNFELKEFHTGQGLKNMRMRIERMGGIFEIKIEGEFKLWFWIPLKKA